MSLYLFITVARTRTMNGRSQRATKRTFVIDRSEQHAKFVCLNCVTSYHLLYDDVLACARGSMFSLGSLVSPGSLVLLHNYNKIRYYCDCIDRGSLVRFFGCCIYCV